jgi:hypothetical protein
MNDSGNSETRPLDRAIRLAVSLCGVLVVVLMLRYDWNPLIALALCMLLSAGYYVYRAMRGG